jgi:hypothetical protein
MKHIRNIFHAALLLLLASGCEKDDKNAGYGEPLLFIPQATIGGLRYPVPSGLDSATRNFKLEAGKVKVILGVSRSGLQPLRNATVKLQPDTDTVQAMLNSKALDPAKHMVMPADIFALPATVELKGSGATFYLELDAAKLKNFAGKTLVLAVKLADPSAFALNPAISKVIVLAEVDKLPL